MVRDAGFAEVRSEPFTVTFEFPSVDGLRAYLGGVSAPVRAILAARGPEWRAEFWEKLGTAAHAYADADGTIRLPSDCLIVVARC